MRKESNIMEVYGGKHFRHDPRFINVQTGRAIGNHRQYGFFYCPGDVYPWSVQFCGGGTYFRTLEGCVAYAFGRGWIHGMKEEREIIERNFKEIIGKPYEGV